MDTSYQKEYKSLTTLSSDQLINLVNELSNQYYDKGVSVKVVFNNRLKTTAGRTIAYRDANGKVIPSELDFNPKYLEKHGMQEFIGTIKHELVHYHMMLQGRGHKHGDKDFKEECKRLGAPLGGTAKSMRVWTYMYECYSCKNKIPRCQPLDLSRVACSKKSCRGFIVLAENRSKKKDRVLQVSIYGFKVYHDPHKEGTVPKCFISKLKAMEESLPCTCATYGHRGCSTRCSI